MDPHRSERGATLVEYALLVALVAAVGLPAFSHLRDASLDRFEQGIVPGGSPSDGPDPSEPEPTSPPSTAPPPPPPTTVPPTTAPPTTAPPVAASVQFDDVRSWSAGWFRWSGSAELIVTDAQGRPQPSAVVDVRVTTSGGTERTVTVTTDATGRATIEVGPYDWYGGWGGTSRVDLQVSGVEVDGGTWDGAATATTLRPP